MSEFLAGAFGVPAAWPRDTGAAGGPRSCSVAACWSPTAASRSRTPRRSGRDSALEDQAMRRPDAYREHGRFIPPNPPERPARASPGERAWAYPVVAQGRLYIRDGDSLWCYDVKASAVAKREDTTRPVRIVTG